MKRLMSGIIVGNFVGTLMSLIFSGIFAGGKYAPVYPESYMGRIYYEHFSEVQIMAIAVIIWCLIGVLFNYANLIFTNTDWSLTRMTVTHFMVTLFLFFPLAILAGWFPLDFWSIFSFAVIFIVVYFIIWYIEKRNYKSEVHEINQKLNVR